MSIQSRIRLLHDQIRAFVSQTRTPVPLIRDLLRVQRRSYCAESLDGIRVEITPRSGERFAFYEAVVRGDYLKHASLGAGDVVVDVGANVGCFSLLAARRVGPHGRVFAFEPSPPAFERLCRNIALNGIVNITPIQAAIASHDGAAELLVSPTSLFSSMYARVDSHNVAGQVVEVPSMTLETACERYRLTGITLLKMDCEGAEHEIMATLPEQVAARISQIAMEVHCISGVGEGRLSELLEGLGFHVSWDGILFASRPADAAEDGEGRERPFGTATHYCGSHPQDLSPRES